MGGSLAFGACIKGQWYSLPKLLPTAAPQFWLDTRSQGQPECPAPAEVSAEDEQDQQQMELRL